MQQFLKQPGPDPAIRTPNDSATAMFGHLNVLVNAITALQNQPPPTFSGWELNGNSSLPSNSYIGINDTSLGYLLFSINTNQVGLLDNDNRNVYFGNYSGLGSSTVDSIGIGTQAGNSSNGAYKLSVGYAAGQFDIGGNSINIGRTAGNLNRGNDCISIGHQANFDNRGNRVIALGTNAGQNNLLNGMFIIANTHLPSYVNWTAANAAISPTGVAGNTYLYYDQTNKNIGAVRL